MTRSTTTTVTVLLAVCMMHAPGIAFAAEDSPVIDSATPPYMEEAPVADPVPAGILYPGIHHDGNRLTIPPPDVASLLMEDADRPGPLRVGIILDTEIRTTSHGQWTHLDDGAWLWSMSLVAPGADFLRVRISALDPPPGAGLLLYNPAVAKHVVTASLSAASRAGRGAGEYLTPTVPGDEVRIEYRLPPGAKSDPGEDELSITGVAYIYRESLNNDSPGIDELACHLDVSCYPDWYSERMSVARLEYSDSTYMYNCSGAMLNRVPGDFTPIFMTAEHCSIGPTNINTVEVVWKFHRDSCTGTVPDPDYLPYSDALLSLASDTVSDFRLLGLAFNFPADTLFAGLDAGYWSNSLPATGIHHPGGTYKRISFGTKIGDELSSEGTRAWKIRFEEGQGLTEGGSSGSPIFDAAHRVRGVDSFYYVPPTCSSYKDTYYGRMDYAWPALQPYLDPTDPVYVDGSYSGQELGTITKPFDRVLEGVFAVIEDSHIYIKAGTYDEAFLLTKGMIMHAQNGTVTIGATSP
jgi:lysyl endopeptidase